MTMKEIMSREKMNSVKVAGRAILFWALYFLQPPAIGYFAVIVDVSAIKNKAVAFSTEPEVDRVKLKHFNSFE